MAAKIQQLKDFLDRLEREGNEIGYTWLIGAGMSVSAGIPLAKDVSKIMILFEYIIYVIRTRPWEPDNSSKIQYSLLDLNDFLAWYEEKSKVRDPELKDMMNAAFEWIRNIKPEFQTINIESPECYQKIFGGLLQGSHTHHKFLTALVRRNLGPNLAHLCLAAILRDHSSLGHTVFTTNFDDLMLKSLLSINHTARVYGDLNSKDAPDIKPTYPQIVHLHGRHTGYRLLNTTEQINTQNINMEQSFRKHIQSSSLIVLGYSGWDDLVMKTLSKWHEDPNLIQGDLIWIPFQDSKTILPEIRAFLDSCFPGKVIIVECDEEPLNADSFMLAMLATFNYQQNGFVPYRKEILDIAISQHAFILEQLRQHPNFDPEYTIREKLELAYRQLSEGNQDAALAAYHNAKVNAESDDLPVLLRADSFLKLGVLEMCLELNREAIITLNKSEKLWSEIKNNPVSKSIGYIGEGNAYRALADVYLKLGEVDETISKLNIARSRYVMIGHKLLEAYTYLKQSEVLIRVGNADMAERFLYSADTILKKIKDSYALGLYYKNKGDLDTLRNRYASAEVSYLQALELLGETEEPLLHADIKKNLGGLLIRKKMVDEGLACLETARRIFEDKDYKLGIANVHSSLGDHELGNRNINTARDHFRKAHGILKDSIHVHSLGNVLADLIYCDSIEPADQEEVQLYFDQAQVLLKGKSRNAYLKGIMEHATKMLPENNHDLQTNLTDGQE